MRDTKAMQDARTKETNPYRRRFGLSGWNVAITVADDHRLFARLPEFQGWTKEEHYIRAVSQMRHAITLHQQWQRGAADALRAFGDGTGVYVSGIIRDHFPEDVKVRLRELARTSSELNGAAYAHWRASGRTLSTFRQEYDKLQGRTVDDRPIGQRK